MADQTTTLPSTRHLLTALLTTLATSTQHENESTSANPLATASPNTKSALLTLHTLFPHDLLPALDLLDRGLVTRFVLASEQRTTPREPPEAEADPNPHGASPRKRKRTTAIAHHVRTAQKLSSSRSQHRAAAHATTTTTSYYEVHLTAWSCSCPAFAFAAFPAESEFAARGVGVGAAAVDDDDDEQAEEEICSGETTGWRWRFGGLTRGDDVPACKHLLACVIAEKCGGFARLVEEREVGVEEVAGWAAGWGD